MIARVIAAMMDQRDLREEKVVAIHMGMDMIMIMDMGKAKGRNERGVRMRMRRCLELRVAGPRRRTECLRDGEDGFFAVAWLVRLMK